jgi:ribonuclease J
MEYSRPHQGRSSRITHPHQTPAPSHRQGASAHAQTSGAPRQRRTFSALALPPHGERGPGNRRRTGGKPSGQKSAGPKRGGDRPRGGRPTILRRPKTQPAHTKFARAATGPMIPPPEKGVLRVIPLGGVEEIGKNMTVIETADDILIVDAGFQFSEVETPGVDFILPDVTYLKDRKDKIRGIFITHGHYDHIGAIPYVMEEIGNPPIYSRQFGAMVIQKRQIEFPHSPPLNMKIVQGTENIQIGKDFTVRFFPISHAIPDSMGLLIATPLGKIAFIEDVRVDHIGGVATQKEIDHYKFFAKEDVLLFTMDSTSVEKPGFSLPESEALKGIDEVMRTVPGRLIIGTFASQVERVMEMLRMAEKYNKIVVVDGRSMKGNVEIIKQLGLLKMKNVIPIEEMADHPPGKIVVIATGAQGEEYSVFDRIANKTHKYITLSKSDTVLFSASIIPGNENAITRLKDHLYRQDPKIITYIDANVHASGHGNRGELDWIHKQIKYKFFIPLHGHHYMLRIHAEVAEANGTPKENIIIPDNGSIIEFYDNGNKIRLLPDKAPSNPIMVDGFSVGGQQEVVLRDRKTLAEDGIFMIVISVNPKTGKLRKSPDIISRGFVYLKEQQALINETRTLVTRSVEKNTRGMQPINFDIVKSVVTDDVRKFLFQKTGKSPIVIPVVIGI